MTAIDWPAGYSPAVMPIHVVNTLVATVPAAAVWARLIAAHDWPTFYANAANVVVAGGGDLRPGVAFRWRTFGVNLRSTVVESVADQRITWIAHRFGLVACHAWLLTPTATGCTIVTEETQRGPVARLGRLLFPGRMEEQHQRWLEGLARVAAR